MRVGVLGGLGPFATAQFYTLLHEKVFSIGLSQPEVVIISIANDNKMIRKVISAKNLEEAMKEVYLKPLVKRIKILNKLSDIIVIPCNTVHYLEKYFKRASKKFVSLVDVVKDEIKKAKISSVGVLGTCITIELNIYGNISSNVIYPSKDEIRKLSNIIIDINENRYTKEDAKCLNKIIKTMKKKGAEKILLACTELPLVLKGSSFISTTEVLANYVVSKLVEETKRPKAMKNQN